MQQLLRQIPQVDELLRMPALMQAARRQGHTPIVNAVRAELEALREAIRHGELEQVPSSAQLCQEVLARLECERGYHLQKVINASGIALYTNLGRAPLAKEALQAIQQVAGGYSNLEYQLTEGARGSRNGFVEPLLCRLCGCEAALAVNNNAAALLLALAALAGGRETLISRGELVEIGDHFRVPDIAAQSGTRLIEVGSTNKTHLRDYAQAIGEQTGVLLKVHTSNFRMIGFTESVPVAQLVRLGQEQRLPVVADLGSGALLEAEYYPFEEEPTVPQTLRDGADVVCFSADKLLGGPQAGILLGKRALIEQMRRHPLARALRLDKLSLAALEATLQLYLDSEHALKSVPVLQSICAKKEALEQKAQQLASLIRERTPQQVQLEILPACRPVGGGAAPGQWLEGYTIALSSPSRTAAQMEAALRAAPVPVIAYIREERLLLDVATIAQEELLLLAQEVAQVV